MRTLRDNRWMSFEDIISDATHQFRDMSSHNVNRITWSYWASQGCKEFAKRSNVVRGVHYDPLVIGQELYRLPADCLRPSLVTITYPGEASRRLTYRDIEWWKDGVFADPGYPLEWYISRERQEIGIRPVPDSGGYIGYAAANGDAGGNTIIGGSDMSATDDIYNGRTIRIMDGANQGLERVVTDYDGTTKTITVSPVWAGQVLAATRFVIHPESLQIDYIAEGNAYSIPPATYVVQGPGTPRYEFFRLNLPLRHKDWWKGMEVRFTSGVLAGEKTRIVSSLHTLATNTVVTVFPELPALPTSGDSVIVTDVPNIPQAFHPALVDYCLLRAKRRAGQNADEHIRDFMDAITAAVSADQPPQEQEGEQMNTEDVELDLEHEEHL